MNQETKDKISKTLMGHKISEKTRKILLEKSPFKKGFTPWNKGRPWPIEMKQRISETNKRKGIEPKTKFVGFGINHPRWKGGIYGTERHRIMGRREYKLWRTTVFERDRYTCTWCGQIGGVLNADHIIAFSEQPELRFAIDNGRTLCVSCHKKRHHE
jgi:hypothetical protein